MNHSRLRLINEVARRSTFVPVSLLLLGAAGLAPDHALIRTLRGDSQLDRELNETETNGYYEAILDANQNERQAAHQTELTEVPPPRDWVNFGSAGIVEELPTYLRWKMKPSLAMTWNGLPFHTNRHGYRTPEVDLAKPEGVYRILVFGSSNTMGHGVDDDSPYPHLLERWLNDKFDGQRKIEVVNLAVSGDSPSRRLLRLREEAERYQPDWILCDATVLDYALEETHLHGILNNASQVEIPLPYIAEALAHSGAAPGESAAKLHKKLKDEIEPLLEGAYSGWRNHARSIGVPLAVLVIPRADRKVEAVYIERLMRDIFARHGITSIDVSSAFDPLTEQEFRVSPWDKHPSVKGHEAIFDTLRQKLEAEGSLPGLPLPKAH